MSAAFDRRLATYRRRRAEQEAFYATNVAPLNEAHEKLGADLRARNSPEWTEMFERLTAAERESDRYFSRTWDACLALVKAPAPSLEALATKLEIAIAEGAIGLCDTNAHNAAQAMLADVKRLAA